MKDETIKSVTWLSSSKMFSLASKNKDHFIYSNELHFEDPPFSISSPLLQLFDEGLIHSDGWSSRVSTLCQSSAKVSRPTLGERGNPNTVIWHSWSIYLHSWFISLELFHLSPKGWPSGRSLSKAFHILVYQMNSPRPNKTLLWTSIAREGRMCWRPKIVNWVNGKLVW